MHIFANDPTFAFSSAVGLSGAFIAVGAENPEGVVGGVVCSLIGLLTYLLKKWMERKDAARASAGLEASNAALKEGNAVLLEGNAVLLEGNAGLVAVVAELRKEVAGLREEAGLLRLEISNLRAQAREGGSL